MPSRSQSSEVQFCMELYCEVFQDLELYSSACQTLCVLLRNLHAVGCLLVDTPDGPFSVNRILYTLAFLGGNIKY